MSPVIIYNMQYSLVCLGAAATRVSTGIATSISGRAD
jgi:hypothetical protein